MISKRESLTYFKFRRFKIRASIFFFFTFNGGIEIPKVVETKNNISNTIWMTLRRNFGDERECFSQIPPRKGFKYCHLVFMFLVLLFFNLWCTFFNIVTNVLYVLLIGFLHKNISQILIFLFFNKKVFCKVAPSFHQCQPNSQYSHFYMEYTKNMKKRMSYFPFYAITLPKLILPFISKIT